VTGTPDVAVASLVLAQSPQAQSQNWASLLPWIGALVVLVALGAIGLVMLRRRLFSSDQNAAEGGVSLDTLRQMRARGELSEQEFEAAKRTVVQQLGLAAGAAPPRTGARAERLPRATASPPGELRAPPGFDLTGEPLPRPTDDPGPRNS
jgi:hypothetical protein